jgi:hypothetical protein
MSIEELEVTLAMLDIKYSKYSIVKNKSFITIEYLNMDLAKTIKYLLNDNNFKYITSHNTDFHFDTLYIFIGDKK